jgi:hypothetical protein
MLIREFLWGMLTMAHLVVSLLLLRFWRLTRDRLFLFFAASFATLGCNWLVLALLRPAPEDEHLVYLIRLLGSLLLIVGIIDKNRRSGSAPAAPKIRAPGPRRST